MSEPSFDIAVASRWFAVETNNATWDWLYAHHDGDPIDPIIHQAHASYFHWSTVGTVINQARAASLLANVHAAVGNAELATRLAHECLRLTAASGADATDWDVAFAHDCLARAMASSRDGHAPDQKQRARAAGNVISDPQDKQVFDEWFVQGNWHGLS